MSVGCKKYAKISVCALVVGYLFLNLLALLLTHFFLFMPPSPANYKTLPHMRMLSVSHGLPPIAEVVLHHPKAPYTVLFSHGNGNDLGDSFAFIQQLAAHGFNVVSYDYNGYGQSAGTHTEQHVYDDIQAVYDDIVQRQGIDPKHIIVMAHSLGTGPSIYLAAHEPVHSLILMSPYLTIFSTRMPFAWHPFFFDRFKSVDRIKKVHAPLLIVHGTDDDVVPFVGGKKLFQLANAPKRFYAEKGRHHTDLVNTDFWRVIKQFTAS